jgi:hypothetical protein
LYFYDEVDNKSAGKDYSMANDELLQRLGKLIDTSEVIQEVMYYTNPLVNSLATSTTEGIARLPYLPVSAA